MLVRPDRYATNAVPATPMPTLSTLIAIASSVSPGACSRASHEKNSLPQEMMKTTANNVGATPYQADRSAAHTRPNTVNKKEQTLRNAEHLEKREPQ